MASGELDTAKRRLQWCIEVIGKAETTQADIAPAIAAKIEEVNRLVTEIGDLMQQDVGSSVAGITPAVDRMEVKLADGRGFKIRRLT